METHRFASMIGIFSFLWKLVNNTLMLYRRGDRRQSKMNGAISGFIAGIAVLVERRDNRIAVAQQLFFRSTYAGYNALKTRSIVSFPYGDALVFAISCGSIMVLLFLILVCIHISASYNPERVLQFHGPYGYSLSYFRQYSKTHSTSSC